MERREHSMKNKTILYFISAFLWLGVAFSTFYIYQNSDEQEVETLIQSSNKIDDLHQDFYDLEYSWWERNTLAKFVSINKRDIEILNNLDSARKDINSFKNYSSLLFSETEPKLPKLSEYQKENYTYQIEGLVANESIYLNSELTNLLYKNMLLYAFRIEWQIQRDYKIYEGCMLFFDSKPKLDEVEKNKIALYTQSIFNYYTVGYFTFPKNMQVGIFNGSNKGFEFEMIVKTLGRNSKTVIKKYRTLPKEGQELQPFDYEEIE